MSRKTRRNLEKKLKRAVVEQTHPGESPVIDFSQRITDKEVDLLWEKIIRAAGAEPRGTALLRGASGLQHKVLAVGVDDDRKRVIVISGEHDARSAALAQADIQSALKSLQVIVARPVAINLGEVSRQLTSVLGGSVLGKNELERLGNEKLLETALKSTMERVGMAFALSASNVLPQILQGIQQLSRLKLEPAETASGSSAEAIATQDDIGIVLRLDNLNELDPTEHDRRYGICPVPLYNFSPEEVDSILTTPNTDVVKEILREHDLLQYFFPAPDQVALGLVDRGVGKPSELIEQLEQAPELGHPYGETEITSPTQSLAAIVDELRERNLIVEGEVSMETTAEGDAIRQTVRFKPKEGLVSKLINRFEIKLDFKDLFGGGK